MANQNFSNKVLDQIVESMSEAAKAVLCGRATPRFCAGSDACTDLGLMSDDGELSELGAAVERRLHTIARLEALDCYEPEA